MRSIAVFASAWLVVAAALAQTPARVPHVGVLHNGTIAVNGHLTDAFADALAKEGFAAGRNVVLDVRYAGGQLDRLPALARELAELKIDVVFAPSALASNAMRKSGYGAPIVFALAPDPIGDGFVASLARPGGTMTGLTSISPELAAKRVELLHETFPKSTRIAVLHALPFPGVALELAETERAAKRFGEVLAVEAKRPEELEGAFGDIAKWRADVLLVIENPMFFGQRKAIADLAQRHRIPAVYRSSEYVAAGGLMSYGANYADLCRRAAGYVAKILRGASPADLPVEQPVHFELVVNLGAAKAQGFTIPREILLRADRVIE